LAGCHRHELDILVYPPPNIDIEKNDAGSNPTKKSRMKPTARKKLQAQNQESRAFTPKYGIKDARMPLISNPCDFGQSRLQGSSEGEYLANATRFERAVPVVAAMGYDKYNSAP
jgi:hypothetical protein